MGTGASNIARIGYDPARAAALPAPVLAASAGCGNPLARARPRPGETVLDLGSGGGLDCFLAAGEVGPTGRVIGLDMTGAMLEKAEAARRALGLAHVEFRRGEMEAMPLASAAVDIIISNCAVNLSPDKAAVFREAFRVLRPGGRLALSDVLRTGEGGGGSMEEWCACIAGALTPGEFLEGLRAAGFEQAQIAERKPYIAEGHESMVITAEKPG
ncbi:MAG: methyltransferase domain-containing protein [Candidatus Tectomicrobia bacterium]|uniref:Arsenite methyltransferase n=1 Tax=Tectimicrobiota bacterium TaxID=2528274 RepID=A0A932MKZ8_UNCTE|nr:methyltransferase domain-containing protein [Candidatus Tectomicrobia bacterium]